MARNKIRYSEQDVKALKTMWGGYNPVTIIAKNLDRSPESVIQKARILGLKKRGTTTVKLVGIHGRDILKFGKSSKAIMDGLRKKREAEKLDKVKEATTRQAMLIDLLIYDLDHMTREAAVVKAIKNGLLLRQVASVLGVSTSRVGQIVHGKK